MGRWAVPTTSVIRVGKSLGHVTNPLVLTNSMRIERSRDVGIQDLLHYLFFASGLIVRGISLQDAQFEQPTGDNFVHLELNRFPVCAGLDHGKSSFLHLEHELVNRFALGREPTTVADLKCMKNVSTPASCGTSSNVIP